MKRQEIARRIFTIIVVFLIICTMLGGLPRIGSASEEVITVEDTDAGFSKYGTPSYWWEDWVGGDHMYYTYNGYNTVDNYAEWTPSLPSAGTYPVYVWIPANHATTTNAIYTIHHNGQDDTRYVRQIDHSYWIFLGYFYFSASGNEYVKLVDMTYESSASKQVGFDAVRWVKREFDLPQYVNGIDVSHWQGTINWAQVYNAGFRFAFVKATQGTGILDENFVTNMNNGRNAGMFMGAYHYATPDSSTAAAQANYFVDQAGGYITAGYLRPALDLEETGGLGKTALSQWVNNFMTTVKSRTGVEPIIYTSPSFANDNLDGTVIDQYDLWIAHWRTDLSPSTAGWDRWDFWQHIIGAKGSVPGINAEVDWDRFNGDISKLQQDFVIGQEPTYPIPIISASEYETEIDVGEIDWVKFTVSNDGTESTDWWGIQVRVGNGLELVEHSSYPWGQGDMCNGKAAEWYKENDLGIGASDYIWVGIQGKTISNYESVWFTAWMHDPDEQPEWIQYSHPVRTVPCDRDYAEYGVEVKAPQRTITFYTDPTNGGTITFDGSTYNNGQSTTKTDGSYPVSANPAPDYEFDHWTTTGGVSVSNPNSQSTTATVTGTGSIKAWFNYIPPQRTITFYTDPIAGGTITFDGSAYSNGGSTTKTDGSYPVSANPASNYVFDHWSTTGGVSVSNPNSQSTTATVSGDGSIKAWFNYIPPQRTITFYTDPTNGGTITFDGSPYGNGQSTTKTDGSYSVSASPASNYVFDHWSTTGGVSVSNPNSQSTTATVSGDGSIKAWFNYIPPQHTIIFYTDPTNGGTITFDGSTYNNGQSTTKTDGSYPVSANPAPDYEFDHWTTTGGVSVSNPNSQSTTATVSGDGNIKAWFNYNPMGEVNLSIQPAIKEVGVGEVFELIIQADAGDQPISGIDAFVDFDPTYLEVQSVTPGASLPTILDNSYDNMAGTTDYSAGKLGAPFPSGTFTVATIQFRALVQTSPNTALTFSIDPPRQTRADYAGDDVTGTLTGGTVTITADAPLFLDPASSEGICIGQTFTLEVKTNVDSEQPVSGVQAFIDFDPAYLEVQSVTPGPSLPTVLENTYDNTAGTVDYSAGKLGAPFSTGMFTVATIEFKALAETSGTTAVTFSFTGTRTTTVDLGGSPIPGIHGDATVEIIPGAIVDLSVVLQGGSRPPEAWEVPITIKFFSPGADVMTDTPIYEFNLTTTKSDGTATCQCVGVMPGTYDITAQASNCPECTEGNCTLTNRKQTVVISAPSTAVDMGTLLAGDANCDGIINISDFGILAVSYLCIEGEPCYDCRADFDCNGIINISDFGLLAVNYMIMSPVDVS